MKSIVRRMNLTVDSLEPHSLSHYTFCGWSRSNFLPVPPPDELAAFICLAQHITRNYSRVFVQDLQGTGRVVMFVALCHLLCRLDRNQFSTSMDEHRNPVENIVNALLHQYPSMLLDEEQHRFLYTALRVAWSGKEDYLP